MEGLNCCGLMKAFVGVLCFLMCSSFLWPGADADGQVVIGFDSRLYSTSESQNVVAVLRIISGSIDPGDSRTVEVSGLDGTALGNGIDYDFTLSHYTFSDTTTVHFISVTIVDDIVTEQIESFQLQATTSDAGVIIDPNRVDINIIDNDPKPDPEPEPLDAEQVPHDSEPVPHGPKPEPFDPKTVPLDPEPVQRDPEPPLDPKPIPLDPEPVQREPEPPLDPKPIPIDPELVQRDPEPPHDAKPVPPDLKPILHDPELVPHDPEPVPPYPKPIPHDTEQMPHDPEQSHDPKAVPPDLKPVPHDPEPVPRDPEPVPRDPEPVPHDPEPVPHDPEPVPHDPEPVPRDPEPVPHDPEPVPHDPEPQHDPKPVPPDLKPAPQSPEPVPHDPEPVPHDPEPPHDPKPVLHDPEPVPHGPQPVPHGPKLVSHGPQPVSHDPKHVPVPPQLDSLWQSCQSHAAFSTCLASLQNTFFTSPLNSLLHPTSRQHDEGSTPAMSVITTIILGAIIIGIITLCVWRCSIGKTISTTTGASNWTITGFVVVGILFIVLGLTMIADKEMNISTIIGIVVALTLIVLLVWMTVKPKITTHPIDHLDIFPMKETTFFVEVRSCGRTKYQWQKDGTDIPEATSQVYTIPSTRLEHEGSYRCVVSNGAGKVTSKTAKLTVLKPPIIENSPSNMINVVPGEKTTLTVTASGGNLKYQWKKNVVAIPGATSNAYSILETTYDDEGEYQCVVSNSAGETTSDAALVTVLKLPVIDNSPTDMINVVPGKKATLSITASGGNLKYQWLKDVVAIPGATSSTFTILNTTADDEGEYQCVVSNDAGDKTSNVAWITVLKPPVINNSPTDMINVVPGKLATLSVIASGDYLKYQWKKNAVAIPRAISSTYSIRTAYDDEGEYQCVVSNNAGSRTSDVAQVTVLKPPVISNSPTDVVNVVPGEKSTLSVTARGDNLEYQWQKDEVEIRGATSSTYSILKTATGDEGGYQCVVSNGAGERKSDVAYITVLKCPVIDKSPTNIESIVPGRKATLSVTASGENLHYQWKKNAVAIPGATSCTYSIPDTTYDDEGEYQCVVSNDAGSKTSNAAQLTVLKPPVIDDSPTDMVNVVPGKKATLSVTASGDYLKYQWKKNAVAILGATSSTYSILKTTYDDEGEYQCVVSNGAGDETSDAAQITVLKLPFIDNSPTDLLNVIPGEKATLSVTASGDNLHYQWQKDAVEIPGATSSTYSILKTTADDEGEYQCVVSNSAGSTTSDAAQIALLKPPVINNSPTDIINIVPGDKATLSVTASGDNLHYQWKKNAVEIPGATSCTYSILETTYDDEGEYQCVVSNDAGSRTSDTAQITILKPPVINKSSTDLVNVVPGNKATLSVTASGDNLHYQWIKNAVVIPGANSRTYSILKTTYDDEGEYQCVVSNGAGDTTSDAAQITLLKPPVIINNPTDMVNAVPGRKATLSVTASGGKLKYQWLKNTVAISGATSSTYSILKTTAGDEGKYQCVVSNGAGEETSDAAQITVLKFPFIEKSPTDLFNVLPGEKATLSVTASGDNLEYQWQKNTVVIPGTNSNIYSIQKTTANDEGAYQCVVSNEAGSMTSDPAQITVLKPPVITKSPSDMMNVKPMKDVKLSVSVRGANVKYQWRKDGEDIPGATSCSYSILKTTADDKGEYQCIVSNDAGKKSSDVAKITVSKPVIIIQPTDLLNALPGVQATFSLSAKGYGLKYQWQKDSTDIPGANSCDYTIQCTTDEHEGEYRCVVSDPGGEVTSDTAKLTVCTIGVRLQVRYVLYNNFFSADVEEKVVKDLNPLSTVKDIYDHICTNELGGTEKSLTIQLFSHECQPLNTSLDRTLKECKVVKDALFHAFICRVKQPMVQHDEPVQVTTTDCSPQGKKIEKLTYDIYPSVSQTDRGVSKFFSILKFICSKKRDDTYRSRLLSYLLHLTNCPPMVHALKLLCENSELSLPYWVALAEGCYRLFHSFMSKFLTEFQDEEVFEFSDYFWGLIIGMSQLQFEVTTPKREIPISKWTDLHTYLVFLPIFPPDYLVSECLTFIDEGHLVYFEGISHAGDDPDKKRELYYPVKCEIVVQTIQERKITAREETCFNKVITDLRSLPGVLEDSEPEEAIMVLLDSSSSMEEEFDGITRMKAAKEFIEAFAICCQLYKFNVSMGLITFSSKDKVRVLCPLHEMDNLCFMAFEKKLNEHNDFEDATALYQAVEKASEELKSYNYAMNRKYHRRILCLGDGDHSEGVGLFGFGHYPVEELKEELKRENVTVDAIVVADTPGGSLKDLTEATGGRCLNPRHCPKLFEMHELLCNKHHLRTTAV